MNEHTLPEDQSRWPSNPFELLGVLPGVNERDLRRAYTRLIRIYKPEHFPEQFRRIREAFDSLREYASSFSSFDAPPDPPAPAVEQWPRGHDESETPLAGETGTPVEEDTFAPSLRSFEEEAEASAFVPSLRSLEEELDEAWDWAVGGDEARAYAGLLELHDRHPGRSEICLRLYGLLGTAPELDDRRSPCDFLVQGLRKTGGTGPCHEAYEREIEDDPGEALTERFAGLLDSTTQPGLLATFVRWRWGAVGRRGRFEVIGGDLPGLRARLAFDEEEIWLRLLAFAADQLAWALARTGSIGLSECLTEAASHTHLQLRCADVFDRLECLERAASGWHSLMREGNVPVDLLELLSHSWTRPASEIRRRVMTLLAAVGIEAERWLGYLDRVNEKSPQLLSVFGRMLDSYQQPFDQEYDDRDPAQRAELARHFFDEFSSFSYPALRVQMLAFCLRESIDPDVIAQAVLVQEVVLPEVRSEAIVNDWPVRFVYRACILSRS